MILVHFDLFNLSVKLLINQCPLQFSMSSLVYMSRLFEAKQSLWTYEIRSRKPSIENFNGKSGRPVSEVTHIIWSKSREHRLGSQASRSSRIGQTYSTSRGQSSWRSWETRPCKIFFDEMLEKGIFPTIQHIRCVNADTKNRGRRFLSY